MLTFSNMSINAKNEFTNILKLEQSFYEPSQLAYH